MLLDKHNLLRDAPLKLCSHSPSRPARLGRFGQFIGEKFTKYGRVVGTSRSDYTQIARDMGAEYVPLSDLEAFVLREDLDVIVLAVSILSFEDTVASLVPHLRTRLATRGAGSCPLIVDVLSVKVRDFVRARANADVSVTC